MWVEACKVSHCLPFGGKALNVRVGDVFGNLAEVVDVKVSLINSGVGDTSCWVDKGMVS